MTAMTLIAADTATSVSLPGFPLPRYAQSKYGGKDTAGFLRFMRELHKGGVPVAEPIELADSSYAIIDSTCIPLLSAWLEEASKSVGVDLAQARSRSYDGSVYARLLEVVTSIATVKHFEEMEAVPIGMLLCKRSKAWGSLPGDGQRDAYILIATEKGFLVFDPPTRQLSTLGEYPNTADVLKIRF
jgi:hypothetical protein